MEKLKKTKNIFAGSINKSMIFTSAIGISLLDNTICRLMNNIANSIYSNNPNPKYKNNIYEIYSPIVRTGNSYNRSTINFL